MLRIEREEQPDLWFPEGVFLNGQPPLKKDDVLAIRDEEDDSIFITSDWTRVKWTRNEKKSNTNS